MDKPQAIKIIEDVTSKINTDRQTHQVILQAIEVLKKDVVAKEIIKDKALA